MHGKGENKSSSFLSYQNAYPAAKEMSIHQFFILSPRGDSIITKDFRGDAPVNMHDAFFHKVKFWEKGDCPPIFEMDGLHYLFIRRNSLLIVCTTRFNISPSNTLVRIDIDENMM